YFRRAGGKIDNWNVGLGEPIDNAVNRLARHDFFALRPRVHVAMHAGEIAKLAHVDLKNLRSRTAQLQTFSAESISKAVHVNQQQLPPSQHLLFASVVTS